MVREALERERTEAEAQAHLLQGKVDAKTATANEIKRLALLRSVIENREKEIAAYDKRTDQRDSKTFPKPN